MVMPSERKIFQNAWVVDDLMAACNRWIKFYGVGPFYITQNLSIGNVQYRGAPGELRMSVGLAQAGDVQIELIEQHSDSNSAYRDMYKKGQHGFHHCCVWSSDYEADMKAYPAAGYPATTYGGGDGSAPRFAYFDARKDFDIFLEIVEPNDAIRASFKRVADAAATWDGKTDPIRINQPDGSYTVP